MCLSSKGLLVYMENVVAALRFSQPNVCQVDLNASLAKEQPHFLPFPMYF